jgi:head-tail adaptor
VVLFSIIIYFIKHINIMKTLKCDLCDHEAQGETFEEWMNALKPHHGEAHADVMNDSSKTKEDRSRWMAEAKARFEAA